MARERRGRPYDKISAEPKSDLGAYLYASFLRNVVPGLIKTSETVGEFAVTQTPRVARKMRMAAGRLSKISAEAARGRISTINIELHTFSDYDSAESFRDSISRDKSEILPVPSSITQRLHDPYATALDGFARDSHIQGVKTLLTGVHPRGSNRRLYTVKLVGYARLRQPLRGEST